MKKIVPFDYQNNAVRAARTEMNNNQRILVVSPPGSGKTVMLAELTRRELTQQRRVLVIAQRRELLKQAHDHLVALGVPAHSIGSIYPNPHDAGSDDLTRPVQIASMATLLRRDLYPSVETVILDEAHHAVADGHLSVLEHYRQQRLTGLTATPMRLDGRGLGDVFDVLYEAAKPSELINNGLLAKPRSFTVPENFLPDLEGIKIALGDYQLAPLAERVNKDALVGNIVDHYQQRAAGQTALVFATSIEHSQHLVARFQAAGVPAGHLDSTMSLEDRDGIVDDLRTGVIKVVCNMGILHEGFDLPRTYAVILARPTMSLGLYLQQTGRALRKYGNQRPLILDHARNIVRFGLPEADREFDLYCTIENDVVGKAPVVVCPNCQAVISAGFKVCPECGYELRETVIIPDEDVRTLEEMTRQRKAALKKRLEAFLASKGKTDPAWVARVIETWTAYSSASPGV